MFRFFIAVVVVFSFFRVTADVADGLIFHANFDAGLKAAYAAGNPEAQVQGAPADYLVPGLRGNGVLVNGGKTELSYETSGNLSSEAGTLSMFVYSYDFTLDDTFYHVFFDTFAEKSMFLLYKYFNQPNQIIFFCQSDLKVPNKHYNLRSPELDWPKGVWKHLAVTWTQSELCFYLDGKPLPPIKTEQTFLELGPRFYLGASVNRWGSLPQQPDTVIDEVRIYNRALAPEEIGELAAEFDLEKASRESVPRQGKTVLPRTEFQVPFTEQPPVIDGKIDPTEWRCATALSGLVSLEQKRMTEQQARFLLACDRDNLYVAMESPRESDLPLQGEKSASRDNGDLCMGDAYELFFEPGASGRDANVIQFMGNFLDDIFDRRGNDVSWNADVKVKNSVTDSMWSMEMAIPWRELGRNTPDENEIWGVNLARDFTGVAKWSSLEGSTYGEAGKLLKMRFGGDVSIQAPVLAGLETVQPEFRYRIVNHAASGRTLRIFNRIYTAEGRIVKQQEEEQFLLDGNSERFFTVGNRDMAGQLRSGDTYFHEFAVQSGRAGEYIYRGVTPFRYLEASAAADRKLSGEALKKAQAEFSAPWLGNQQGIDHSVPEPWTPVKFDNGRLEVWGRVYDFSAGILPGAIRSVDVDLFSGVPELILESGGSRCDLARLPFEVAERHPDVIVLKGEGQCGGLNAAVTVKVEFDGMLRCDLELVPLQGEARLERLSLTAGFPESNTEFVHYFLEKWQSAFAGKAPAGEIKLPFRRQFWIGNGDVGFAWFSPSAAHTTSWII